MTLLFWIVRRLRTNTARIASTGWWTALMTARVGRALRRRCHLVSHGSVRLAASVRACSTWFGPSQTPMNGHVQFAVNLTAQWVGDVEVTPSQADVEIPPAFAVP